MNDKNLYNDHIFIIEKRHFPSNTIAFATAPFFLVDEDNESITIKQIRDANFSENCPPKGIFKTRLYTIKKKKIHEQLPLNGLLLFRTLIRRLLEQLDDRTYLPLKYDEDFQKKYPLKLVAELNYPIMKDKYKKPRQGIIEMTFEKNKSNKGGIYLYNPTIKISKEYLRKLDA